MKQRNNDLFVPQNDNNEEQLFIPHDRPSEYSSNLFDPSKPNQNSQSMSRLNNQYTVKKRWYKSGKFWSIFATTAMVLVSSGIYYEYNRAHAIVDNTHVATNFVASRHAQSLFAQKKPFTVMLLGTDTGELGRTDRGRTDTIMLATINAQKKEVLLTSISRDTLVSVPGYKSAGPQKMNAAYELGNIKATQKTLEKYLNVPIDAYALVNMKGLVKSVNRVNGIEVASPLTFTFSPDTAHENGKRMYKFYKGKTTFKYSNDNGETWVTKHRMNGQDALAFSRMRYMDPAGDYGRQLRQRLVITTILKKAMNMDNVLSTNFLETLSKSVITNLSFDDIIAIGKNYHVAGNNIQSDYLHGQPFDYQGVSYQTSTQAQKQRLTNKIRKLLGLKHKQTGNLFSGVKSFKGDGVDDSGVALNDANAQDGADTDNSESSSAKSTGKSNEKISNFVNAHNSDDNDSSDELENSISSAVNNDDQSTYDAN